MTKTDPFESPGFTEMWETYHLYLQEQFGIVLDVKSYDEKLLQLKELSEYNPIKALQILEYLISNGKQSLYLPDDDQLEDYYIADEDLNE